MTRRTIKSKKPLTPAKARLKFLRDEVERAKKAVKLERERQRRAKKKT